MDCCYFGEEAGRPPPGSHGALRALSGALSQALEQCYPMAGLEPPPISIDYGVTRLLDDIRKMCDELIRAHEMESFFKKGRAFRLPRMWNA